MSLDGTEVSVKVDGGVTSPVTLSFVNSEGIEVGRMGFIGDADLGVPAWGKQRYLIQSFLQCMLEGSARQVSEQ
jgi:hypothetical protein